MEFLAPGFLLLLPLAAAPWLWRSAKNKPKHTLLRSLSLLALIVAVARPARVSTDDSEHVVILLDQSASVSATEQARAEAQVSQWQAAAPKNQIVQLRPWGKNNLNDANPWTLSDALSSVTTQVPAGEPSAILLASDGHDRGGRWADAVATGIGSNFAVHGLELRDDPAELRVVGMQTVEAMRIGHPATMQVVVCGGPARVQVDLSSPQFPDLKASSEQWVDGRSVVEISVEPTQSGIIEWHAELQSLELNGGHDLRAQDNHWSTQMAVRAALPVLYLGQRTQGGLQQLSTLLGPGFALQQSEDFAAIDLSLFAALLVDDRPASSVPAAFQQRVVQAVTEDGLGLLMCGGAASFGPGGWQDTALAELLPVEFVQKEEKRDPSTTLVVIIDTSGSMGGNRVQLAKEVSRLAIRRLLPHDKVGIVEFYGAKRWAAPIQAASNSIELERALNRLDAGGGTVILPAVEEAFYGLQNVQTRYKHVLILTDGGVETGPFESMMRRMADKGINVSTVLIGSQAHSEFLVNLANWGKGRFYHVPNRFNLPEVILKQPASAKLPAYRPGEFEVVARGSAAWWGSADAKQIPPLNGYVECRPKTDAEVVLSTLEGKHPVLASWRYGAGRVTALTTEPTGPGTQAWSQWPGYGTMLAQVIQRTALDQTMPFEYAVRRNGEEIVVLAQQRQFGGQPQASVNQTPLSWLAIAPGLWQSRMTWPSQKEFPLQHSNGEWQVSPAQQGLSPEFQVDPLQILDSEKLATLTGGSSLPAAGEAMATGEGKSLKLQEYASWFLVLALLLFFAEIYYRRRPSYGGVA